jgi:hypothetical protein
MASAGPKGILIDHLGEPKTTGETGRTSQGADADAARTRALAAYKDFLTLWKDADPDIPILKQAKAEYAKLQSSATNLAWRPPPSRRDSSH